MATALLETGSGSGSTPESAAADKNPPKRSSQQSAKSFFDVFLVVFIVYNENNMQHEYCQMRVSPVVSFHAALAKTFGMGRRSG